MSATLSELAAYQAGRGVVYAALGCAAGGMGAAVSNAWRSGAFVFACALAVGLLLAAVRQCVGTSPSPSRLASAHAHCLAPMSRIRLHHPFLGMALIGVVMAALPCAVAFWGLALAASTMSAAHGAAVMLALVVMTSLPLALVALLPQAARRLRVRAPRWLVPASLVVSAGLIVITAFAAAASNPCPLCATGG